MTRTVEEVDRKKKFCWSPPAWEAKARIVSSWYAMVDLSLGQWAVGTGFDLAPTCFWLQLGPMILRIERDERSDVDYNNLPNWSWTLWRLLFPKCKLEIRLELDLNIWRFGYAMADLHDHGLYLGPVNLQIEYDKFYRDPVRRSDDLFEFANLFPSSTGLPMTVWLSLRGSAGDDVRIRVNPEHGDRTSIRKTAVIAVRPTPHMLKGRLAPADQQAVFEWLSLNVDVIAAYWVGEIGAVEMAYKLKPIHLERTDIVKPVWRVR